MRYLHAEASVAFNAEVLWLMLGTRSFWCFRVSKQTHLCRSGWSGAVEVVLMQMRWCSAILVVVLAWNCVSVFHPDKRFFCGFGWCAQKMKRKKKTFHVCFVFSFVLTYVFHLLHISLHIKIQFLMQLSLCWLGLMDDSYQECLQDTSRAPANNVFQTAYAATGTGQTFAGQTQENRVNICIQRRLSRTWSATICKAKVKWQW